MDCRVGAFMGAKAECRPKVWSEAEEDRGEENPENAPADMG